MACGIGQDQNSDAWPSYDPLSSLARGVSRFGLLLQFLQFFLPMPKALPTTSSVSFPLSTRGMHEKFYIVGQVFATDLPIPCMRGRDSERGQDRTRFDVGTTSAYHSIAESQ
jgi:hypothetical protein